MSFFLMPFSRRHFGGKQVIHLNCNEKHLAFISVWESCSQESISQLLFIQSQFPWEGAQ